MGRSCSTCCPPKKEILQHTQPDIEKWNRSQTESSGSDSWDLRRAQEFHNAIASGNNVMLTYHAGEYPTKDLMNIKYDGETPLHTAVNHRQYVTIQYLLENDSSPNNVNDDNETPLHSAVRIGDVKAVELLLKYNADKCIKNDNDKTPISIALQYDTKEHFEITVLLEPDKTKLIKHIEDIQMLGEQTSSLLMEYRDNIPIPLTPFDPHTPQPEELDAAISDLFNDFEKDLSVRSRLLLPLEDWLDRKQQSVPYQWLKRWVIVKGKYLLWSDRQITIDRKGDHITAQEKHRWNKCIHLRTIKSVEKIVGKKNRRFKVKTKEAEYVFRANIQKRRDYWVMHLSESVEWQKSAASMGANELAELNMSKAKRMLQ